MTTATNFLKEAYFELKKSSWLSRKEAIGSTWAVIILVGIISLYVAGIDFVLSIVLGAILGR
jgi:preprotein translocase SecE subunit